MPRRPEESRGPTGVPRGGRVGGTSRPASPAAASSRRRSARRASAQRSGTSRPCPPSGLADRIGSAHSVVCTTGAGGGERATTAIDGDGVVMTIAAADLLPARPRFVLRQLTSWWCRVHITAAAAGMGARPPRASTWPSGSAEFVSTDCRSRRRRRGPPWGCPPAHQESTPVSRWPRPPRCGPEAGRPTRCR